MAFDNEDIFDKLENDGSLDDPPLETDSSASDSIRRTLEKRRKWRQSRNLIIVFIVIVLFAILIICAANLGWSPAFLRNSFGTDRTADAVLEFSYEAHAGNVFASLDEGLVIASDVGLQYLNSAGEQQFLKLYGMSDPAVTVNGKLGAVWDIGSPDVRFFDASGELTELETSDAVISVSLNSSGWSAVTARESGYKGAVTVYDDELSAVYKWYVSSAYISCAVIDDSCEKLCAVTYSQDGVEIVSTAHFFTLSSEDEQSCFEVKGEVFVDCGSFINGNFYIVSDKAVYVLDPDGKLVGSVGYDDRYLIAFSSDGIGNLAVALSAYSSGSKCDILCINDSGSVRSELETENEIRSVSCAEGYVAALFTDHASVYTENLKEKKHTDNITGIKSVIMLENGSVLLAGSDAATIFAS